mmetsp:Transcript_22073/g.21331  ORF Transcript_22073/g.21331 Transcript_22073/m.21331 type:complete len:289 (-) Transcript_22073:534-1400(-)
MIVDYVAGVAGGVAVVVIGHPFDTTKTRLQTSPLGYYNGTIDCVKKTLQSEGIGGFYSGIGSPLMGQMFFRAASFATFYKSLDQIAGRDNRPTVGQYCLAGAVTGFCIAFIEAPIDLIKTKIQIEIFSPAPPNALRVESSSVVKTVSTLVRQHGVISLWQGLNATLLRNIPANAMFFPVNEITKRALAKRANKEVQQLNPIERFISGAAAGLSYWVGTFPLDAIKARIQATSYDQRKGWIETAKLIFKEGGFQGFARGLAPSAARSVPACATMFATVDVVRDHLNSFR